MTQKTDREISTYYDIEYEDIEKKLTDEWQSTIAILRQLMPLVEGKDRQYGIRKIRNQLNSAARYGLVERETHISPEYRRPIPHYRRIRE